MEVFDGINAQKLDEIIRGIKKLKVALIGDLCLDVYWLADMTRSELSRETPHFPLPVVKERMSPGAGGNAAANIAALGPAEIKVLGVKGTDWRGDELVKVLQASGVNTGEVVASGKIMTNAYCKPVRKGISPVEYEDPRLDFTNYRPLPHEVEAMLLGRLDKIAGDADILCVSDQFVFGCITPAVRESLISLGRRGKRIVVDSRDRIGEYSNVVLKPNEVEGLKAANNTMLPEDAGLDRFAAAARLLAEEKQSEVCMTLGSKGCLYTDGTSVTHILCHPVLPPIDFCGAGDTFLSAFSCALATGVKPWEAAAFANMAAEVTIKKTGTTGTASPEEIKARHREIFP